MNPYFPREPGAFPRLDVEIRASVEAEADELWSYVGNNGHQRWTWYAIERESGVVFAWHNGRRTDQSCESLIEKLSAFPIGRCYTDDWQSYGKYIPSEKHVVGKDNTWRIERRNLNFRTHLKRLNRKTICFSKSARIHDNVVGTYVSRFYFKTCRYSEAA